MFQHSPQLQGAVMEEVLSQVLPCLPVGRRCPRAYLVGDNKSASIQVAVAMLVQMVQVKLLLGAAMHRWSCCKYGLLITAHDCCNSDMGAGLAWDSMCIVCHAACILQTAASPVPGRRIEVSVVSCSRGQIGKQIEFVCGAPLDACICEPIFSFYMMWLVQTESTESESTEQSTKTTPLRISTPHKDTCCCCS